MKPISIDWPSVLQWLNTFVVTFIPLFVVVDPIGNLPFIISLSETEDTVRKRRIVDLAVITATIIGLVFLFLGKLILTLMDITVGSFTIAGGIILVVLSVRYMTTGHMIEMIKGEMVAIVPIGTPLIVGPATITTLLLLTSQYPDWIVLISFALNMLVTWAVFLAADHISRFLSTGGIRAIARVLALLLSAIGVNMVIRGLYLLEILAPKIAP
jgi:multiple antibiotic resistance protein